MIFDELRRSGRTKADVAAGLHIPLEELNKIVFGLVLTPLAGDGDVDFNSGRAADRPDLRVVRGGPVAG